MQGLDALKAAAAGSVRRKGRSDGRISALEAAYEEYRLIAHAGFDERSEETWYGLRD